MACKAAHKPVAGSIRLCKKEPAAGFFRKFQSFMEKSQLLALKKFFRLFSRFARIPIKFHENFDEIRSDSMKFVSKSQKIRELLENMRFC